MQEKLYMKLSSFILFMIIALHLKNAEAPLSLNRWVVWNVGQGQWVTHLLPDACIHFDIGGEFGSFKTLKKTLLSHCGGKTNRVNLSHWDYDHFLNIIFAAKALPDLCWEVAPDFGFQKKSAQKVLSLPIPACKKRASGLTLWIPKFARNTNEASIIFFEENILMTGDSPIQQEKLWIQDLKYLSHTRVLILGHHGSRTSTSTELLNRLNTLKFAIASVRYQKYRHPHPETLQRLSVANIPLLKTEDWGNIWFE